jgi:hypothetical protein
MEAAVRDLTALYQQGTAAGDGPWDRARADLRDRVAQAVVRTAAAWDRGTGRRVPGRAARDRAFALLVGAHGAIERERRRAEAQAELGRMAEARAASERAAQMGVERQ